MTYNLIAVIVEFNLDYGASPPSMSGSSTVWPAREWVQSLRNSILPSRMKLWHACGIGLICSPRMIRLASSSFIGLVPRTNTDGLNVGLSKSPLKFQRLFIWCLLPHPGHSNSSRSPIHFLILAVIITYLSVNQSPAPTRAVGAFVAPRAGTVLI